MRSLCVRLHPIIVIVTAEPGGPPTEVSACSRGKHSVRELALPSKLKWWVGWWVGWVRNGSRVTESAICFAGATGRARAPSALGRA